MPSLRLPGLIDPHVHVRDLTQSHKEDWDSCTASALAGGVTLVLAMPNTQPPLTSASAFVQYEAAAQVRARCDYGIFAGAGERNIESIAALAPRTAGLKMYLDSTFGDLKMESLEALAEHCARWPANKPLLAHAEERMLAATLLAAHLVGRSIHVCHVSRKSEIELIARAKDKGFAVTCEVCPHHLFLTQENCGLASGYAEVRPRLATQNDLDALWANLAYVDCFATDHAPHTRTEKESANPPPGFPGVETALALWLTAAHEGRLTLDDIIARMHANPRRIFHLPEQPNTWIEIDPDFRWTAHAEQMHSRAGWSPYEGRTLIGKVTAVTLRGQLAYEGGKISAQPGFGQNIVQSSRFRVNSEP